MRATGLLLLGCLSCGAPAGPAASGAEPGVARGRMVEEQIAARGVSDAAVLRAMRAVPRHEFVPAGARGDAYADQPLPIGNGQTISQPYIVALMSELAAVKPGDRVLEIGTGSGYQAAVLCGLVRHVYSIEVIPELAATARERLLRLGYRNVSLEIGDGNAGWPEHTPYDGIIVTAAAAAVPAALLAQLRNGGRMILPVGESGSQELVLVETSATGTISERTILPVAFVPLVGGRGRQGERAR